MLASALTLLNATYCTCHVFGVKVLERDLEDFTGEIKTETEEVVSVFRGEGEIVV